MYCVYALVSRELFFFMYELFYYLEKYWKKYQYATKFIQLVKSKTPKVTLYTKFAKCMLMENSPDADLEMCFYDGGYCMFELQVQIQKL